MNLDEPPAAGPPGQPPPGYYDVINPDGSFGGRFRKTWWDDRSNIERTAIVAGGVALAAATIMGFPFNL